uniref:ferric-chelate reductase (NADPH) n=1 Tax=Blastobotrys adeninivorans TaxID=409370 RepID=A0A060THE5_BLAAD
MLVNFLVTGLLAAIICAVFKVGEVSDANRVLPFDLIGGPCLATLTSVDVSFGDCQLADRHCLCRNEDFLISVAICIDDHAPDSAQDRVDSAYAAVSRRCNSYTKSTNLSPHRIQDIYTRWQSTVEHPENRTIPVRVPEEFVSDKIATKEVIERNEKTNFIFGLTFVGYWGLVVVIAGVKNFLGQKASVLKVAKGKSWRRVQRLLLLPPMCGTAHSELATIEKLSFYMPRRLHSLVIAGYAILTIVLMCIGYEVTEPNYIYPDVSKQRLRYAANRLAELTISQLPILVIFGSRNNILSLFTGWPFNVFNCFHRWIGRVMVVFLLLHGVLHTIVANYTGIFARVWNKAYWIAGVVGLIAGILILTQSIRIWRLRSYESFLIAHLGLAAIFIVSSWIHLIDTVQMPYVYCTISLWLHDYISRIVKIIHSGVTRASGQLYRSESKGSSILVLNLPKPTRWACNPGRYAYVHFLGKGMCWWQSHPFSVVVTPKGSMQFIIRVHKGITEDLCNRLRLNEAIEENMSILVDGPYGSLNKLDLYDNWLIICGGVGITGVYSYALEMSMRTDCKFQGTFVWVVYEEFPLTKIFRDHIQFLIIDPRIKVKLFVVGGGQGDTNPMLGLERLNYRPQILHLLETFIRNSSKMNAVMTCGPGRLNDEVRQAFKSQLDHNPENVYSFFEESFTW